jgi:hypothetical protein
MDKCLGDERFAHDLRKSFQDLELAIGLRDTYVNVLSAMMIGLHRDLSDGWWSS